MNIDKIEKFLGIASNAWIDNETKRPEQSGFYWIHDESYHGVTVGYFDSTYNNGRGQWEVWNEKPDRVYRQTDIYVTHWKEFEEPGQP